MMQDGGTPVSAQLAGSTLDEDLMKDCLLHAPSRNCS